MIQHARIQLSKDMLYPNLYRLSENKILSFHINNDTLTHLKIKTT